MRVLVTSQVGSGHFHPLVPLALALREAGHEVAFAGTSGLRRDAERLGFPAFAAGIEPDDPAVLNVVAEIRKLPYWEVPVANHQRRWGGIHARAVARDLLALAERWRPDLYLRDSAEYGACVAAESLGLPHASVRTTALSASWDRRHLLAAALNELRGAHGLAPDGDVLMPFRYLQIVWGPPGFKPPGESFAPNTELLRPALFDRTGDETLPEWVHRLPERPTVYATLGTVFNDASLLRAIVAAAEGLEANVILTVGRERDPAEFPGPPNLRVERYIPQSLLLPRCDLVVAHGGYNTVIAALDHGLPMVLTPVSADQPENAAWCSEAGLARVLPPGEQTVRSIRAAVRDVLANATYRARAEHVRDEMHALPGVEHAVRLLERVSGASRVSSRG